MVDSVDSVDSFDLVGMVVGEIDSGIVVDGDVKLITGLAKSNWVMVPTEMDAVADEMVIILFTLIQRILVLFPTHLSIATDRDACKVYWAFDGVRLCGIFGRLSNHW